MKARNPLSSPYGCLGGSRSYQRRRKPRWKAREGQTGVPLAVVVGEDFTSDVQGYLAFDAV